MTIIKIIGHSISVDMPDLNNIYNTNDIKIKIQELIEKGFTASCITVLNANKNENEILSWYSVKNETQKKRILLLGHYIDYHFEINKPFELTNVFINQIKEKLYINHRQGSIDHDNEICGWWNISL